MFRLIQNVVHEVKLSSSVMAGSSSTATLDLQISALFELSSRTPRQVPSFPSEVCWFAPCIGCRKVNIDGSAIGSSSCGAIGVVFRDCAVNFLGGFVQIIGHASAFFAELCATMFAIEKVAELNWTDIWIETDSKMVVKAFNHQIVVPWAMSQMTELPCIGCRYFLYFASYSHGRQHSCDYS